MSRQPNGKVENSEKNFQKLPLIAQGKTIAARTVLILGVVLGLLLPVGVRAQVAFDASTSGSARLTSLANTLTLAHTSSGTNLVLVVGISMNISTGNTATASGVTYNGTALVRAGFHNDATKSRRSEIWYLINPATGNHNVVVTLNIPVLVTIGTVVGAATFTGADQTTPIRTYISNDGNNNTAHVDVPSGNSDMVLDTLALDGTVTATTLGGVQQWAATTGAAANDVYGFGSTRAGAPNVPMAENLSATAHWSDSAVSIQPVQGNLSLAVSGSSVLFPANVTYTVTVNNGGPSASAAVVLTDTLASGLTFISATPSQGSCSGATTITCSLGTINNGATATVTIVATPVAPGGYPNSASVTATTADLTQANNSATGVAYSELNACASSTATAGGNLGGVINTYYLGKATANAGSTSITLGAATGAANQIATGDLVLIIQMQDATINTSNSSQYGDGVSGAGATQLNNAGGYEYATATNTVLLTGGTLNVTAAGPGGGLIFTYTSAAASATQGARTFQVIRVPNYSTATLTSTLTASAWNGSTGGVLALNVSGVLTLNNATVSVNGLGFRGGAGLRLQGSAAGASNTDYLYTAPVTYTTPPVNGADGSKGEGIAGTPHYVESGTTVLNTNQTYAEGYPLGSMARGAPGNAGGGGTDADPTGASPNGNDQNAGGGGGSNGGAGGVGGNSWSSNLAIGGLGGAPFPAGISSVVLGGGGGAGSRNNTPGDTQASSAAAGGGIVLIRAGSLSGNATINANGAAAYNGTLNDAGGGGGAGGSVVILWGAGVGTGLTINAQGGRGGDAWDTQAYSNANRHGPGGGGGGGVILLSGDPAAFSVAGGASGTTLNPGVPYGATAGVSGFMAKPFTLNSTPGPHSAAVCTDMSISKSGAPSPVLQTNTLTYTVTVKNLGPSVANTVQMVDALPSQVTFVSATPTRGSCSQSAGVVTCNLGNMNNGETAIITIVTTATVGPALTVNTAVVNSATADASLANNTATASIVIETPTSVNLMKFIATQTSSGALLSWRTGGELHNLGFNVYRDVAGQKIRLNPSLIAGSALLMRDELQRHGAKSYGWIDRAPGSSANYWLEDVDLNGTRTMHGPVSVQNDAASINPTLQLSASQEISDASLSPNPKKNLAGVPDAGASAHIREAIARPKTSLATQEVGFRLAGRPAVKILVDHEGWYRVTQPQLVSAGLNPNVAGGSLHLFAEGIEQPIRVTGSDFGVQSAIEFYGTAIDTPYSGRRVYWLVGDSQAGARISGGPSAGSPGPEPSSFIQTLELKPRTTYFAALLRDDTDNFFGPLISPTQAVQTVNISNLALGDGFLEVALQGVTQSQAHDVTMTVNGSTVGDVNFNDQLVGKARFVIPAGTLVNGVNAITLTAQLGSNDLSFIDYIDVSFPHTFTADSDLLKFTAVAGAAITVNGFSQPPTRLIDVTNPNQPLLLAVSTLTQRGGYALKATVPWTSPGTHSLLALSDAQLATPAELLQHHPSNLHSTQPGAEIVMLTAPEFIRQVQPLQKLHEAEGQPTALINVNDVYDEFNFGERTPYAIRNFLQTASAAWKTKPHYLLLAGDASVDPRNYFGFGFFDFVPTKVVITSELKTASDDWFSDFDNTGFAQIASGRLPARTPEDAEIMTAKLLGYGTRQGGSWTNRSTLVADVDSTGVSFSQAALGVQRQLPQTMDVTDVFTSVIGATEARNEVLSSINAGQLLVNYNGHGSVEVWGSGLFDDDDAAALTNGERLPLFVAMNCLNGFFHDVYTQSLAEALILSRNGGAVAVWASSGLTAPTPQFQMDQTLVQTLFASPGIALGDAILRAKSSIIDSDTRKTFILFGDPAMRLKSPENLRKVQGSRSQASGR